MAERGRPKGSQSRNKDFLMKRLQDMYGEDFDPIMMAAKNAHEMNGLAQLELTEEQMRDMDGEALLNFTDAVFARKKECVNAFDKIAQYVQPKLKAIELTADIEVSSHEAWLDKLNGK
jgi:acyl-[acyl carrier protein]--UDP-N-acetylglucosamine O-acyltransferase